MPSTRAREGESVDSLMRRFRRSCDKEGRAAEARRRAQGYKPKSELKRRAKQMAEKRLKKKIGREIKQLLNGREHHKGGVGGSGGLAGFIG
jgi:small subunit ribosomal protein S21